MNGFPAFLQQAGSWLAGQARITAHILGAVNSNQSAPARQVIIYTVVLATVLFVAPKALKKFSK